MLGGLLARLVISCDFAVVLVFCFFAISLRAGLKQVLGWVWGVMNAVNRYFSKGVGMLCG